MVKGMFATLILNYLRFFARLTISYHRPKKIIGITGSLGKSSLRNLCDILLKEQFKVKTVFEGNSQTGVPLGILGLQVSDYSLLTWIKIVCLVPFRIFNLSNTDILILEMGIDSPKTPKNMSYLLSIIKPDIAIILNVHAVHAAQFETGISRKNGTVAGQVLNLIAKEKSKIMSENENCRLVIYNDANSYVKDTMQGVVKSKRPITLKRFGNTSHCDMRMKTYEINNFGTVMSFQDLRNAIIKIRINQFLLPKVYQEVFAAAILLAQSLGLKNSAIINRLEKNFYLPPGRAGILAGKSNAIIIDSTYNASPASVTAFIDLVTALNIDHDRTLIFIFGDMKELGSRGLVDHQQVADKINRVFDHVYLTGPLTKLYVLPNLLQVKEKKWFENSSLIGEYLANNLPENSLILAKGSQNGIFIEEALKPLLEVREDSSTLCRQTPYWLKVKHNLKK
ncbi:hypothetical protein A3J15_04020 [Candidatus Roizmanbacteria bacterium RIFCSPLOWO2_02_FULL_38_10]|uniref:Mur ligase central domain-containing protein n=1 Tax=Candidatus Roizmanbacteria bacterium RIFCSPLOWO2_02_FULL_38_10 TaxID=1802074 RepID=A0A1F7JJU8_9BACT|nr:MAG: hypothetical protein A3J15_04020 [Candidatus Roizmanbacteria bacterium RIFCSPLOWO2_02_FULL_38_10]